MENEIQNKREKWYILRRSIADYGMGVLYIAVAIFLFFPKKFGFELILEWDLLFRYMFGGICVLYGGFRMYRGYKKDYL